MKNQDTAIGAAIKAPNIHNGTYTVNGPKGHFTVKLHTVDKPGAFYGKRILSILIGPNNETDFSGVAFWDDDNSVCRVWKRFVGPDSRNRVDAYNWQLHGWSMTQQKLAIWCDLSVRGDATNTGGRNPDLKKGYWAGEGYTLLLEGHCVTCNRKLTNPTSILTGIGPVCGKRV